MTIAIAILAAVTALAAITNTAFAFTHDRKWFAATVNLAILATALVVNACIGLGSP